MSGKIAILLLLLSGPLFGGPPESLAVQEMRLSLDQIGYQLNSHQVELDLFQERIQKLERTPTPTSSSSDARLARLEKAHEALLADCKSLQSSLSSCQSKLTQIDKQLTSDIKGLKDSLHSMLALLQGNDGEYIVKPGDSLGQIALDHKTDLKTLKQLNNLSNDTIRVGQKLVLP